MPAQPPPAESAPPPPVPTPGFDWPGWLSGALLAGATVAAYGRTFAVPLLFDDVATIAGNPSIRHWNTAGWAPYATTAAGRPILNLSLALNYAIGGTAVGSYHALNLAIHVLAGLTLFGIVRRTLAPRSGPAATGMALAAALLWALHPLQTESVTYLVQRAESLMGLFYLLTLYGFIRGAQAAGRPQLRWFGLCLAACLLGMGTKEVMVSAPLIVLLYDRTFLAGSFREAWRRRGRVYAGLAATWAILPLLILPTHGRGGTAGFGSGVSWWTYAPTQFPAILRYLRLSVWPHPLIFNYGTEWVKDYRAIVPAAAVVVALLAATTWGLLQPSPGGRRLGFAGAWFFAILAPTSLVPIGLQTAAEHRMYLALVPLAVLAVVGFQHWLGRAALPLGLALAAVLGTITWERNADYRSALTLWAKTVADCPDNPYARDGLACELQKVPGRTEEAIAQSEEALRLKPDYAMAHNNLGGSLEKIPGRMNDAIAQYQAALRLNPGLTEARYNLGHALAAMPGRLDDAIAQYEEALRANPGLAEAHYNLGYALSAEGRLPEAIDQYEETLRLDPDDAGAHNNLGKALSAEGRTEEAIAHYREALRLDPGDAGTHDNLGNALSIEHRAPEAIAQYEEALRLRPDDALAHNNLGNALSAEGRTEDAIAQYAAALQLKPDFPLGHLNLARALLRLPGRTEEAVAQLEETLRLQPANAAAQRLLDQVRASQP